MNTIRTLSTVLLMGCITALSAQSDTTQKEVLPEIEEPVIQEKPERTNEEEIFVVVEVMPEFPGGTEKMLKFVSRNIDYPDSAREFGIEGRVVVQFVVDTTGDLIEAKIVRGIGYGCDEEVLRVISIMPKWSPGMQRGKKIRVRYNLPVQFQLTGDKPKKKERKERKRRLFRNKD